MWWALIALVGIVGSMTVWLVRSEEPRAVASGGTRTDCVASDDNDTSTATTSHLQGLWGPLNQARESIPTLDLSDEGAPVWGLYYAGMWLDGDLGKAVIVLTADAPVEPASLEAFMPIGAYDLEVRYGKYSYQQLRDWHRGVDHWIAELGLDSVSWTINEASNRVEVTASDVRSLDQSSQMPPDAFRVYEGTLTFSRGGSPLPR